MSFLRSVARSEDLAFCTVILAAAAILLVPFRGAVPSIIMAAITVAAGAILGFDRGAIRALGRRTRWLFALFAGLMVWQLLGVLLRAPFNGKELAPLGWTLAIGSFLLVSALSLCRTQPPSRLLGPLFVLGVTSAVVSLVVFAVVIGRDGNLMHALHNNRLIPFGRASHPIIGAGGLAAALFAGAFLWGGRGRSVRLAGRSRTAAEGNPGGVAQNPILLAIGLGLIMLTLMLTQSRGPLLALAIAFVALGALRLVPPQRRSAVALALGLLCFLIPVSLVLAEPLLFKVFCGSDTGLCRPTMRQEVWFAVFRMILEHPLLGFGASRRLDELSVHHPHDGLLGMAFYFGVPAAIILVVAFGLALSSAARAAPGPWRNFALTGLFFAAGFLGTDFSNPLAFFNTHYLFIWLPMIAAVVLADGSRATDQDALPEQSGALPGQGLPLEQSSLVKSAP